MRIGWGSAVPRAKKPVADKKRVPGSGNVELWLEQNPLLNTGGQAQGARARTNRSGQKKRGWRDIEDIRERARLKKMLTDIWHEDIELDQDIFGETADLDEYYTSSRDDVIEMDVEDEIEMDDDDFEDFETKD